MTATLDDVINARRQLLMTPTGLDEGVAFNDLMGGAPKSHRMSVGYSRIGDGDYRLEIRVQSVSGSAFRSAIRMLDEMGENVRLLVTDLIRFPTRSEIDEDRPVRLLSGRLDKQLLLGASIGHIDGYAGSLGYFVRTDDGDGFLSAGHVLAPRNDIDPQQEPQHIYQPGKPDGSATASRRCGLLRDFVGLSTDTENTMDAGIALKRDDWELTGNVIPAIPGCNLAGQALRNERRPATDAGLDGLRIGKVGRTTGFTEATISGVDVVGADVFRRGTATYRFDNLIEVSQTVPENRRGFKPFARGGDSGACYFTLDATEGEESSGIEAFQPIGLHIAAGYIRARAVLRRNGPAGGPEVELQDEEKYVSYGISLDDALGHFGARPL